MWADCSTAALRHCSGLCSASQLAVYTCSHNTIHSTPQSVQRGLCSNVHEAKLKFFNNVYKCLLFLQRYLISTRGYGYIAPIHHRQILHTAHCLLLHTANCRGLSWIDHHNHHYQILCVDILDIMCRYVWICRYCPGIDHRNHRHVTAFYSGPEYFCGFSHSRCVDCVVQAVSASIGIMYAMHLLLC